MILLDGKGLAEQILNNLQISANLDVILVGNDPSSLKYVDLKKQASLRLGVNFRLYHLPAETEPQVLKQLITQLNDKTDVLGFFIQLPLPKNYPQKELLGLISPAKDVDGLNPNSGILPAVVKGIITLLSHYQISFKNKNIVIVNDSDLIGQPLKKYFSQFTKTVTLLNTQTPDISQFTKTADILISATGVKHLITGDMVKEGSVIVDVANGDIDFTSCSQKASYITPTFGGIGPMTIASLFQNLSELSAPYPVV